jgi:hypothetical protein
MAAGPYQLIELPDKGNGSQARGILIDFTGAGAVGGGAGDVIDANGRQVPVIWKIEAFRTVTRTQLPIPANAQGRTNGILIDFTGAGVVEAAVIGTVTTANGVDRAGGWLQTSAGWRAQPLPDQGNGSRAHGILIDFTGAGVVGAVAGDMNDANGRQVPVVWDVNGSNVTYGPLPIPANARGRANAVLIDLTGAGVVDTVAVGTVTGANGVDHAAGWLRTGAGWQAQPLSAAGNGSRAHGILIDFTGAGIVGAVVGDMIDANGLQVPVVWEVRGGNVTHTQLPITGNAQGRANGVLFDLNGAGTVVGEVTTPGQQTRAVRWVNDGGVWKSAPFNTPANVDSTASGIVGSQANHAIAGSVCAGGNCRAVAWQSIP